MERKKVYWEDYDRPIPKTGEVVEDLFRNKWTVAEVEKCYRVTLERT